MKTVNFEWDIYNCDRDDYQEVVKKIEVIGRTCYKSEASITPESGEEFIKKLINRGHLAMIEHHSVSVKITCDRGVSHELVRHRLASFAQESTRYCNYSQDKFGNEITVVDPSLNFKNPKSVEVWKAAMLASESFYNKLIEFGEAPQMARTVLPNSLKTVIWITGNLREWRTIFGLRTPATAHPQMREIMCTLLEGFKTNLPVFFEDIPSQEEVLTRLGLQK